MAKARPKVTGHSPNTPGDPRPDRGNVRPPQRNLAYRRIGQIIIQAWEAAGGGELNREALQGAIVNELRLNSTAIDPNGDPMGQVEVGIVVDPRPVLGRKFVWIVVPYPEAPSGITQQDWINEHKTPQLEQLLGEAILFGCGR